MFRTPFLVAVAAVSISACGQGGGEVVRAVVDKTDVGAGEQSATSAEPLQTPASSATIQREAPASSSPGPSSSAPASEGAFVCMMWQVCDCNEGCVGVNAPTASPAPGTRVTVAVGAHAGESAYVDRAKDKAGKDVLVVGPSDPAAPRACSIARQGNVLGYACASSKAGPVPVDACARGCGGP